MSEAWSKREQLAADYVLGTLPAAERAAVERLAVEDAALARLIAAWQQRLAALDAATPPVEPPPELWRRIAAALPPAGGSGPAEGDGPAAGAGTLVSLRRALRRQRWATAGFGALAAGLALLLLLGPSGLGLLLPEPPPPPGAERPAAAPQRFVSLLRQDPDQPGFLVEVDLARGEIVARPVAPTPPAVGGDYELWLVDQGKPRSLGLLPHGEKSGRLPLSIPQLGKAGPGALLAVSLEPAGGSPSGQPTGPVVFRGRLIPLPD
ncbi:Anti-sigma-K factor RskA [Tistlia consotensis]|uniref:Anti-sigma-K factor RskA n=1 Tax=Tistlia consotensis USBA 355 TaxID=560819 RepID=A0A1Y6BDE3_9PROT|nr:anti-sigma factor [Tistlia consotensis]SME94942.1 Anti-sigma-K factor RskA [Tistlia consotensis USBA 355]SNR29630.1 Anti-sigma-K factor RskA [Tistlia consotensis]